MGPCRSSNIAVNIGGTLVAPASYTSQNRWIAFKNVSGLTVAGGLFDGQGQAVWNCKNAQNECPSLSIENSNNVWLKGVSSVNSELFHILIHRSRDVLVTGAQISAASDSPNTDGIHIEESAGVTVRGGVIGTGDDCISIGPGAADVWIENIKCGPGHGISIGSLGSETMQNGVRNVTAMNIEFNGTDNGFRIKTWAKPSDGFVEQVLFRNATMNAVKNPIIIDQHYCPRTTDCPTESSGIRISGVVFEDVHGSSATEVAVELNCSDSNPCRDVWLSNINLSSAGDQSPATMSCSNVYGGSHDVVSPPCCIDRY
ncbi:hypothetical protein KSP40_PGU019279 [Platanthera guangdongensis]|uniref:Polygalacturonase n=1 Tax=Platanthera guangdongensis TaxID=2320717 RepID=A0ABR2MD26_9ASPA